ncbi:hypothetical protein NW768_012158 [Fusarium equiseti]|uniref:Cell wall protein n=1 Tax=Fusarium equiseti TaxID=61235 RepID=A0ABQ8QVG8_FUSEQ|nr:hypothetical protein NW768_012158 [Fusarium equiseti]
MIPRHLLTGTVVLLGACLANASPCRPSTIVSSSTIIASVGETAAESETSTSTTSSDISLTTTVLTETGTTVNAETTSSVTSVETTSTATSVEPTTTALVVDITTTTSPITSAEATTEATTTTAAARTTGEEPEALQTIYLYAQGSNDPSLAPLGGTGFSVLSDSSGADIKYIAFTDDVASPLFFTLSESTGKVMIGNGPHAGKLLGYSPLGDYSFALAANAPTIGDDGLPPVDCNIVPGNGIQKLQCQFGNKGNADFWTCGSNLVLVNPGVDFSNRCPRATTSYKLGYIQVVNSS